MTTGAFSMRVNLADLTGQLDADATAIEATARPVAQAAAQLFYDEVKRNVARLKRHTGNLDRSIYQAYSKDQSGEGFATYHVSWNAKKAPHGHLVEYGHLQRFEISFDRATGRFITHKDRPLSPPRQVAAKPFVRPALSKAEAALDAATAELFRQLETAGVVQ
ncbi:HK97 gp10 family phage protein [Roseateles cavernae]|uniref:HK97 gp10 family phage protein n=1 Tax=Roseateles cavernae TaxID=3153578 RepID=UPI0032E3A0CF